MVCSECKWGIPLVLFSPVEKHITSLTNPIDLAEKLWPAAVKSKWQNLPVQWQVSVAIGTNLLFSSWLHWNLLRLPLSYLRRAGFSNHDADLGVHFKNFYLLCPVAKVYFSFSGTGGRESQMSFPNLVRSKSGLSQIQPERYAVQVEK